MDVDGADISSIHGMTFSTYVFHRGEYTRHGSCGFAYPVPSAHLRFTKHAKCPHNGYSMCRFHHSPAPYARSSVSDGDCGECPRLTCTVMGLGIPGTAMTYIVARSRRTLRMVRHTGICGMVAGSTMLSSVRRACSSASRSSGRCTRDSSTSLWEKLSCVVRDRQVTMAESVRVSMIVPIGGASSSGYMRRITSPSDLRNLILSESRSLQRYTRSRRFRIFQRTVSSFVKHGTR